MFLICKWIKDGDDPDYFGPFPTKGRAEEYAKSFPEDSHWTVLPLIVPNCVTVRLNY